MKLYFLLLFMCSSVMADYRSEKEDIAKFEKEEFLNFKKNYRPFEPGTIPELTPDFQHRLLTDPKQIQYFIILSTNYRLKNRYKFNKAFALSLESKFKGVALTDKEFEKVFEFVDNEIMKGSFEDYKKAIKTVDAMTAYFDKIMERLNYQKFN